MFEADYEGTWDPDLGVWVGSRASAVHKEDFPNPLYVFGYGSLIWRPGELLEPLASFHCVAQGYRRIFAQRSCDHRGTVDFPGVVLNLIPEEILERMGYEMRSLRVGGCQGLVWLIPQDMVQAVIEDLDYREKGGYSRHFISVTLNDATPYHEEGSMVQALVYTGRENNPNFYLPSRLAAKKIPGGKADSFGLMGKSSVVDLISASIGPSGPNTEYLFRLLSFLEERQIIDEYLRDLSTAVQLRIGLARYRHLLSLAQPKKLRGNTSNKRNSHIVGWGSNEYKQLSHTFPPDLVHYPSHLFRRHADLSSSLAWQEAPYHYLFAGGASTAYLDVAHSVVHIWGKVCETLCKQFAWDNSVRKASDEGCHEHGIVIEGVAGVALGQEHSLLLLTSGFVVTVGEEQVQPDLDFVLRPDNIVLRPDKDSIDASFRFSHKVRMAEDYTEVEDKDILKHLTLKHRITKISVGLKHSMALTADGEVFIWGDVKYLPSISAWKPATGAKVIDISSGARHAVIVDDQGSVYTVGSNKHGALGRELGESQPVDHDIKPVILPQGIRFQRASSGWSHSILRGVSKDGESVFYAWGRKDMRQYLSEEITESGIPVLLKPLPDGLNLLEVWCGSEFTIVADEYGRVW
eukprot:gene34550-41833_t